jgi:hypothetical protein
MAGIAHEKCLSSLSFSHGLAFIANTTAQGQEELLIGTKNATKSFASCQ